MMVNKIDRFRYAINEIVNDFALNLIFKDFKVLEQKFLKYIYIYIL